MTESPISNSRRRFRLQLSLRTLLALMAVVGIGLAIFRWPWVETSPEEFRRKVGDTILSTFPIETARANLLYRYERRTTFRRNWQAKPVKNGPEQIWRDGQLWHEAHYYDGKLTGRRRVFDHTGQLIVEGTYGNGLQHGPFRAGDGTTWFWDGNYFLGARHGRWRCVIGRRAPIIADTDYGFGPKPFHFDRYFSSDGTPNEDWWTIAGPADPVVVDAEWKLGLRHGRWTWKTLSGEVLNTAEYDENWLVRWNGEPVVEQFRQWLVSLNDPQLGDLLVENKEFGILLDGETGDFSLTNNVKIYVALPNWSPLDVHIRSTAGPAAALCEYAIENGCAYDYRYGALWLVPQADPEPPFVDPTGISQVKWSADSAAARQWEEVIDVMSNPGHDAECVAHLLAGTSIPFDVAAIDNWVPELSPPPSTPRFRRRRCDALGFVLYRCGCRCELRNGTLHILPRPGRTGAELFRNPLS